MEAGEVDAAGWAVVEGEVLSQLRGHFRPEFLNRVDDVVVFRPLTRGDIVQIVDLQIDRLGALLADRKLHLEVSAEARAFLAELGYDPIYGARPLKRVIQARIQNPLALHVLEGTFSEGDTILVERSGEEIRFTQGTVQAA